MSTSIFFSAHVISGVAMQCFSCRAKLEHLSGDHDAARRLHRSESVDHGLERLWIGIVAIVDDGDVTQLENLPALVGWLERRKSSDAIGSLHAAADRDRDGGECVQNVVFSNER